MKEIGDTLRSVQLDNGLIVEFFDRSNRYFGDYHRLYVEVRCRIPLTRGHFADAADPVAGLQAARALLGNEVIFTRRLEKMGIAGAAVEEAREALVDNFIRGTLSYMDGSAFPRRFIAAELERRRLGRRPHWPGQ
jgi:hypothetical protein